MIGKAISGHTLFWLSWRENMSSQQLILLVINAVGGIAVIGSYILGINAQPGGAAALWGGVPASTRTIYGISMLLAAAGFFAFIYFILFRLPPGETLIGGRLGYGLFYAIFILILLPSALWMPLTNIYIANPIGPWWLAVRLVLLLVGLGAISLVWALLTLEPRNSGTAYWLAIIGAAYFAFHTALLDAIVWPALFK